MYEANTTVFTIVSSFPCYIKTSLPLNHSSYKTHALTDCSSSLLTIYGWFSPPWFITKYWIICNAWGFLSSNATISSNDASLVWSIWERVDPGSLKEESLKLGCTKTLRVISTVTISSNLSISRWHVEISFRSIVLYPFVFSLLSNAINFLR